MKTMEKLIARFNRKFAGRYEADLDPINSYPGYYRICIVSLDDNDNNLYWHMFETCRDFREWMEGVVLD